MEPFKAAKGALHRPNQESLERGGGFLKKLGDKSRGLNFLAANAAATCLSSESQNLNFLNNDFLYSTCTVTGFVFSFLLGGGERNRR